jgi:hypothetical protein
LAGADTGSLRDSADIALLALGVACEQSRRGRPRAGADGAIEEGHQCQAMIQVSVSSPGEWVTSRVLAR